MGESAPGFSVDLLGRVAILSIDRAAKRNALTDDMWRELPMLLERLDSDDRVDVLLIRGSGEDAFSAGADIDEYREGAGDPAWGRTSSAHVANALAAVRAFPKPTLAAIRGHCVGGGVGIAMSCDVRLAGDDAQFAIPPARLGLVFPFADTRRLVDLCGPSRAKLLLFSGQAVGAGRALEWGLVDLVHPALDLFGRAEELAQVIASVSQYSVRAAKRIVGMIEDGAIEEPIEARSLSDDALVGPDHAEGIAAFLEGRTPEFTH